MHLPKWVASLLKIGTSWIPGVGTAIEEGLEHLQERQDRRSLFASLLDLEEKTWRPDASPAALLRADFGVVPFHGREAELHDLTRWCDSDRPLALRLYTAPGGFGKTRLLRHFVRIRPDEWDAGFLTEGVLKQEPVSVLVGAGKKPLLLVLDYAESRTSEIEAVIRAGANTPRPQLRIVLLARAEGDWWSELKRAGDGVGDFFQGPAVEGPLTLPPLTDSLEARRASYQNAVHAFQQILGKQEDAALSTTYPQLDHEDFERVLLVHAAALAAAEGEQVDSDDLLDWLLRREERGIDRVREKQAGLGPEIQRATYHAAALVTLAQGADSRDETVGIISRAPSLKDQPRARQEQIAEVLHVLYQGRRWCDGVEPDLVGEQLVGSQLRDAPELLDAAFGNDISEALLEAGLTVLNRLTQRHPTDRLLLEAAIGRGLKHLTLPAVRVALASGDPIGLVLADALSRGGDIEIARQIDEHLPYPTTSLREVAVQVEEMLWRDVRDRDAEPAKVAHLSSSFSARLADVGRREDALEVIRAAVKIHRDLANAQPDGGRLDLADSLNDLSVQLMAVGRREEAVGAIHEAIEIKRSLAEAQPDAFRADLALSLNNFSILLAAVGRREEALGAIREAVAIYRDLAGAQPDEFKPNFAASLTSLSTRLGDAGLHEEALEVIREAVEIRRDLEAVRPDAFRPDLALSLNNFSNGLANVGRRGEALEIIREVVVIYRDLAEARPDAFRPELASSLNNSSVRLWELGRNEEAMEAIREAVALRRDLTKRWPDVFTPDLASSLVNFSNQLAAAGWHEEALKASREALEIRRDLAETRPDAFRPDLARSLNNHSIRLAASSRHEEALAAIREAVEIRRELAKTHPDAFRPDLAISLGFFQRLLRANGQNKEALHAIQEALTILAPIFIRLPQAYAAQMETLIGDYIRTAEACDVEPNRERLQGIEEILAELRGED